MKNSSFLPDTIYISVNGSLEQFRNEVWTDVSVLVRGQDGLSAYEVAVKNGVKGTEQEWLDNLPVGNFSIIDGGMV